MTVRAIRFVDDARGAPQDDARRPEDFGGRIPLPAPALAAAAARGFSAGNGYLTGQIVDRCA